ncbi:MAG: SPOR domain-containing protein [Fibrobacter sp.]|nr:SPOR domain-containing protein [Fibrobacter sp.]
MMKIRFISVGIISICVYLAGCNPQLRSAPVQTTVEPTEIKKPDPKDIQLTFLDTLNAGNNVYLEDAELSSVTDQTFTESDISAPSAAAVPNVHYRVQVFASSQIETIREQKKMLESKIKLPLFIAFDTPFYKLYVGDFDKRPKAEAILPNVKKLGFEDAWVVSTKAISGTDSAIR